MKAQQYKKTLAAPSSLLGRALADQPQNKKLHEQIYNETTKAFDALYPGAAADRKWFERGGCDETRSAAGS